MTAIRILCFGLQQQDHFLNSFYIYCTHSHLTIMVGVILYERSQPTNKRLQINVLPSETPAKIKDENDVKIVGKNNMVLLIERWICLVFAEFFVCLKASEKTLTKSLKKRLNDRFCLNVLSNRTTTKLLQFY